MLNPSLQHFSGLDANRFKTVTIHEFPNGVEVFIDENCQKYSDGVIFDNDDTAPKVERGEGDREANIERAGRRAKTNVRRRCKGIQADCMITLTYRANMQDEKRVQADFKAFRDRLSTLGAFPYVATLEKQERGALHVHIACQQFPFWLKNESGVRVKSFGLISSMWSRVIGRGNGNVNFTKPRGRNSAHRIASYISKYVLKNVTGERFNKKSYWSSACSVIPKPIKLWFDIDTPTFDIVAMLATDFHLRGFNDITQYADRLNEFHWFAASKSGK
jgi:hypothetical protein